MQRVRAVPYFLQIACFDIFYVRFVYFAAIAQVWIRFVCFSCHHGNMGRSLELVTAGNPKIWEPIDLFELYTTGDILGPFLRGKIRRVLCK